MVLSITATPVNKITYTLSSSNGNQNVSLTDSKNMSVNYTYGSGNNQITNAVTMTGVLSSGQSTQIDLYSLSQTSFVATTNVVFTGVKNFTVYNESTTEGYDFSVQATGTNACTNVFNGGSGNLLVKPYSAFTYNDPFGGANVSSSQRYVYLADQGSGVNYRLIVLGVDNPDASGSGIVESGIP